MDFLGWAYRCCLIYVVCSILYYYEWALNNCYFFTNFWQQDRAAQIAKETLSPEECAKFRISPGWVTNVLKRHNFVNIKLPKEAGDVDLVAAAEPTTELLWVRSVVTSCTQDYLDKMKFTIKDRIRHFLKTNACRLSVPVVRAQMFWITGYWRELLSCFESAAQIFIHQRRTNHRLFYHDHGFQLRPRGRRSWRRNIFRGHFLLL